jgi:hypothetical protein
VSDGDRLLRILRDAARPRRKRRIVCYDAAWASLPPITIYAKAPKVRAGRVPWARPTPPPRRGYQARQAQMVLPL